MMFIPVKAANCEVVYALVDDQDYKLLLHFSWFAADGYAKSKIDGHAVGMHAILLQPESGKQVDHRNFVRLDNRRSNLRICSMSQNQWNRRIQKNNKSGYKGVSWESREQKWRAQIRVESGRIRIGYFDTPEAAARAYNEMAKIHHGPFAYLNTIEGLT